MAHQLQQRQTMRKSIFFLLFSFPISSTTTTSATKFVVGYVFIFQTTKLLQIIILRLLQRENFKQIKKNYKNKPMMLMQHDKVKGSCLSIHGREGALLYMSSLDNKIYTSITTMN